ncbi:MAG: DUF3426 domain-containing protein [Sulfuricella sp.]|nr:DUF3426 domain-containing protein [Sulfuricella sp.]
MAMITTCPACRTRFRVTPEQLAAHGGDVRCGRCAKIFIANNYLEHEPEAIEPEEEATVRAESALDEITTVEAESIAGDEPPPAEETPPQLEAAEEFQLPEETPEEARAPQDEETAIEMPELGQMASDETIASAPAEEIGAEEPSSATPNPAQDEPLDLVFPDWETPGDAPVEEQKTIPEKKRGLFWPWLLGAILLLAGLGGQGLYFFRSDLAARHPEFKPFLQRFCDVLQCSIRLPADPDLLSIEASSLEADPVQASQITLNAILRNRAKLPQEYPQLELALTDIQDQIIARRIFSPKEYAKAADLSKGMPANEEMTVKLYLDLGDLSAAGYRVFLFYPK